MHLKSRKLANKLVLASIIFGVILYQKFPFIKVPTTSVSIRLEDFVIGIVAIYTFSVFLKNPPNWKETYFRAFMIFFGIGALSLVSALFITQTITPSIGFLHWARRIEYVVPFFFAVSLKSSDIKEYVEFVIKLLLITTVIVFIYGVGQKYLGWPVIVTQNQEYAKGIALRYVTGAHLTSTFAGHYDLAAYLVLVLPIFASACALVKKFAPRLILFLITMCGVWLLASSLSRISVVSYFVAIFISLIFLRKFKAFLVIAFTSFVIFSFTGDLVGRYVQILDVVKNTVNKVVLVKAVYAQGETKPMVVLEDRSTSIRLNIEWPRAINALLKNPLLGTGYSSITLATDNDYLRSLGEIGILGTLAGIFIFLQLAFDFVKNVKKNSLWVSVYIVGLAGGFFASLINAVFIDIFEASKFAIIFWLLMGIFVALRSSDSNA